MTYTFDRTKKDKMGLKTKGYEYAVRHIRLPYMLKKELQHIKIDCEFVNEAIVVLALLNYFRKSKKKNISLIDYVGDKLNIKKDESPKTFTFISRITEHKDVDK